MCAYIKYIFRVYIILVLFLFDIGSRCMPIQSMCLGYALSQSSYIQSNISYYQQVTNRSQTSVKEFQLQIDLLPIYKMMYRPLVQVTTSRLLIGYRPQLKDPSYKWTCYLTVKLYLQQLAASILYNYRLRLSSDLHLQYYCLVGP